MKYRYIISAFAAEPWALDREKMAVLVDFLQFKADGGEYSAEEIAARIGYRKPDPVDAPPPSVAMIPVYGVLSQRMDMMSAMSGGTSYTGLQRSLHAALANPDVGAVVLDIDSPGDAGPAARNWRGRSGLSGAVTSPSSRR